MLTDYGLMNPEGTPNTEVELSKIGKPATVQ